MIAATPPRIVTKVVRDKKSATAINNDFFLPLSTATLATSPEPPPGIEWAHIEKQLSPTVEEKEDEDNSNDDGECNNFAAAAKKTTNDDDDYSEDDDGNDGSGYGIISNNQKYDNNLDGGGEMWSNSEWIVLSR